MKTAFKWLCWIIAVPFIFLALFMLDDWVSHWMDSWKLTTKIFWMMAAFAVWMGYGVDAQFKALHKAIKDLKGTVQ